MAAIAPLVLSLLLSATPALDAALEHYEFGELEAARNSLQTLLDPIQLKSAEEIVRARQYLGASHYLLGDVDSAESEFVRLLNLAPEHHLDPGIFPPELVRFFEGVRRKVAPEPAPKADSPPEVKSPSAEPKKPPGQPISAVEALPPPAQPPSLALAFVPFGVGQFNNDRPLKGALFLGAEVALFATAATTFVMFKSACTEAPDGSCRVDPADEGSASSLQTVALTSFYTGLAVTALGVVEALIDYPGNH